MVTEGVMFGEIELHALPEFQLLDGVEVGAGDAVFRRCHRKLEYEAGGGCLQLPNFRLVGNFCSFNIANKGSVAEMRMRRK